MIRHCEKCTVSCSCKSMFAAILDIESYPEFVPGWKTAHIRSRHENELVVQQRLAVGPMYWTFISSAFFREPEEVLIRSQEGPFKKLEISWKLANCEESCCAVELEINAEFSVLFPQRILKPLVKMSARNIVSLFEKRVHSREGERLNPDSTNDR